MTNHASNGADLVFPAAFTILNRWEESGLPLDELLDDECRHLPPRVRSGVTSLLFEYFRRRATAQAMTAALGMKLKNRFRKIIELGAIQMFFQKGVPPEAAADMIITYAVKRFGKVPAGILNAALRKLSTLNPDLYPPALPELLKKRLARRLNAQILSELEQELLSPPPFTFRLCACGKTEINIEAIEAEADFLPHGLFFEGRARDVLNSDALQNGHLYIQDPAPFMMIDLLLKADVHPKIIHDACAAPGGKSLLLAEFLRPRTLIASDRSERRQQRTRENFELRKHFFPETRFEVRVSDEKTVPPSCDLLVLDVPCSNTGVIRRRPDAMWRLDENKIKELVSIQNAILEHHAPAVQKNGYLLYSTCSLEPEENDLQIKNFLDVHPDFKLTASRQLLPSTHHDGAFAALLQRF